jgi:cytochrome c551/c552
MKNILLFSVVTLVSMTIAQAEVVKIELPLETATYKAGPGSDIANAQCLSCHSVEYVTLQPSLPRTYWKGAVDKMITKYAAPVPSEQIEQLVNYLAKTYGTDGTNTAAQAVAITAAVTASPSQGTATADAKNLAIQQGCFNCHQVGNKMIGPSYKDVAAKYKDDPEALAKVSNQITSGGSGKWGIIPMPPYKQLSPAEVKMLGEWVLGQR